jgi:hypothetical protein
VEKLVKADVDEDDRRKHDRVEEQVVAPALSNNAETASGLKLGVFGIPMGEGDFLGFKGGGPASGVDDVEVKLFHPTQHVDHERKERHPLWESQAEEARKALLYSHLQGEVQASEEQVVRLKETVERIKVELEQLRQETNFLLHHQDKPLQRYATVPSGTGETHCGPLHQSP